MEDRSTARLVGVSLATIYFACMFLSMLSL